MRLGVKDEVQTYNYRQASALGNAASHWARPTQRPEGSDRTMFRVDSATQGGGTSRSYSALSHSDSVSAVARNSSLGPTSISSATAVSVSRSSSANTSKIDASRLAGLSRYNPPPRFQNVQESPRALTRTVPDMGRFGVPRAHAPRSKSPDVLPESTRFVPRSGHRTSSTSRDALPTATSLNAHVLRQCVRRCFMPCALRAGYFRKWQAYPEERYRQEKLLHRTRTIAKIAFARLLFRSFKRWEKAVSYQRNKPKLEAVARSALGHLISSTFAKWEYFWHLRVSERRTTPRLRVLARDAKIVLVQRCFLRLWLHRNNRSKRRSKAAALQMRNQLMTASEWFRLWVRQRLVRTRPQILVSYNRRIQRHGARLAFRKWMSWVVNKRLALALEQKNFKILALRYLTRKWMRHFQHINSVAILRDMVDFDLTREAFWKWRGWLERSILSSREEQRSMVTLMQRYFFKWQRHHTCATLSFPHAAASTSRGSSRSSSVTFLMDAPTANPAPMLKATDPHHLSLHERQHREPDDRPNIRKPRSSLQHTGFASLSYRPTDDQFDLDEDLISYR